MPSPKECAKKYKKGSKEYKSCIAYKVVAGAAQMAVPGLAAARGISKLAARGGKKKRVSSRGGKKGRQY